MKQLYPDLWQTEAEHPFASAPRVSTHAYLLLRDAGNVLVYSTGHAHEHERIRALGGITRQYLSHRDEAGPALARIRDLFGSELACHRLEQAAVSKFAPVDLILERREVLPDGIEVIPTPGHTAGSTCFLYHSPHGRTYLFTGDTIYLSDGAWENGFLADMSDKAALAESLRVLRGLAPDVVLSSASVGPVPVQELGPGDWPAGVDQALRPLLPQAERREA